MGIPKVRVIVGVLRQLCNRGGQTACRSRASRDRAAVRVQESKAGGKEARVAGWGGGDGGGERAQKIFFPEEGRLILAN